MDGADGLLSHSGLRGGGTGNAEVRHLHAAVPKHHHVLGLDVPVDDAAAVGVLQRLHDLVDEVQRLPPVQAAAPLAHILLQGDAVDQLHDDELAAVHLADVVHGDDIGVGQHGNGLGLVVEAAAQILVGSQLAFQNFDRHIAVQTMAVGAIDDGHAAGAQHIQNFISIIEEFSDVRIHCQSSTSSLSETPSPAEMSTAVTLSGAPRRRAMSSRRWQQVSGLSP